MQFPPFGDAIEVNDERFVLVTLNKTGQVLELTYSNDPELLAQFPAAIEP